MAVMAFAVTTAVSLSVAAIMAFALMVMGTDRIRIIRESSLNQRLYRRICVTGYSRVKMCIRDSRMTGVEMAEAILKQCPDTAIVFMSAYSDKEYLKAAIKLKAVSYVEKPLSTCLLYTS